MLTPPGMHLHSGFDHDVDLRPFVEESVEMPDHGGVPAVPAEDDDPFGLDSALRSRMAI